MPLSSTAVVLFSSCIVSYAHAHINMECYTKIFLSFVYSMRMRILFSKETIKQEVKIVAPTEAQIRARRKYREKQEYLQTRVSPKEKVTIVAHVASTGE